MIGIPRNIERERKGGIDIRAIGCTLEERDNGSDAILRIRELELDDTRSGRLEIEWEENLAVWKGAAHSSAGKESLTMDMYDK